MMIILIALIIVILIILLFYWIQRRNVSLLNPQLNSSKEFSNKIRIIVPHESPGLIYDAQIYQEIFGPDRSTIVYHYQKGKEHFHIPAKINLFIERYYSNFEEEYPSNENWLMVNQEFFPSFKKGIPISKFICKTQYATTLLLDYCQRVSPQSQVIYTRHTSRDCSSSKPDLILKEKDENLFVHFAGKSPLKQTDLVIKTWLKYWKEFSSLSPEARLVITCHGHCYSSISDTLEEFGATYLNGSWKGLPPNLILTTYLGEEEMRDLQTRARFFLCPSITEGYGHYLNEGRSTGGIIITMDAPPMNELVTSKNGILIPPKKTIQMNKLFMNSEEIQCKGFVASLEAIADSIRLALSIPHNKRIRMSEHSRKKYEEDTYFCRRTLEELLKINLDLNDKD